MEEQNRNSRSPIRDGSEEPVAPSGGAMSARILGTATTADYQKGCGIRSPHGMIANSIPNVFIPSSFIVSASDFAHKPSTCPTSPKAILASTRHAPEAGPGHLLGPYDGNIDRPVDEASVS